MSDTFCAKHPKGRFPAKGVRHLFSAHFLASKFILSAVVTAFLLVDSVAVHGQLNLDGLLNPGQSKATDDANESGAKDATKSGSNDRDLGAKQDQPTVTSTATFGSAPFDLNLIAPLFATPESVAKAESGPVLNRDAKKSYLAGDQAMALRLMFGHMAAEYADAQDSLRTVKYSKLLRRPVWNVRIGVSMWVRDGRTDEGDAMPIPTTGGAGSGGGRPAGGNPFASLLQGRTAAAGSRAARRKPDRGNPLAGALGGNRNRDKANDGDSDSKSAAASEPARDNDKSDETHSSATDDTPSSPDEKMQSGEVDDELTKNLGLVAKVVGKELETRYRRGDFGSLLSSFVAESQPEQVVSAPAAGLTLQRPNLVKTKSPERSDEALTSNDSLPTWKPGIVYVGTGASREVLQRSRDANIDILIHFEVVLKTGRKDAVQNVSRCRLYNVATGKSIGVSKSMDNLEEKKLAAKGNGGQEYVLQRIEKLLSVIDQDVAVVNLPKLKPQVARRRLGSLLSNGPRRSLRTLAEIRLYQMQELLTLEEVETAFDVVGGVDSLLFLYGPADERVEMARAWASESPSKHSDES